MNEEVPAYILKLADLCNRDWASDNNGKELVQQAIDDGEYIDDGEIVIQFDDSKCWYFPLNWVASALVFGKPRRKTRWWEKSNPKREDVLGYLYLSGYDESIEKLKKKGKVSRVIVSYDKSFSDSDLTYWGLSSL